MRRWLVIGFMLCWGAQAQAAGLRIVSLLPSLTESVCALGACAQLVGTDRYSNWPAQVRDLPKLGGVDDVQVERVVLLRPDVVLVAPGSRVAARLTQLGLQVLVLPCETHEQVRASLDVLAQWLGRPLAAAQVWADIQRELAQAKAEVPVRWRNKQVYFEVDEAPYAAGQASFIGQTLAQLGLRNVVPAELGPFPALNPEFVVRHPPDLIMAAQANVAAMATRPGWAQLAALKNKQSCGFAKDEYELLIRPGPRLGQAARQVVRCLASLS